MKSNPYPLLLLLMAIPVLFGASSAQAGDSYSPGANRSYPENVYWGDTHVHTSMSSGDANFMGDNDYPVCPYGKRENH